MRMKGTAHPLVEERMAGAGALANLAILYGPGQVSPKGMTHWQGTGRMVAPSQNLEHHR